MTRRSWVILLAAIVLSSTAAIAEDAPTTLQACKNWAADKKQYHSLEECLIDFFSLQPIALTGGNIGSGSGLGLGLKFQKDIHGHGILTSLKAKALYSLNSFYLLDAQYQIQLPKPKWVDGDLNPLIVFDASRVDLRSQDYYGLGPDTTLAGLAVYREQLGTAGVDGYFPVRSWFGFGGDFHYIAPTIKGVTSTSTPSVINVYGNAGAPGSTTKADFVEAGFVSGVQKSAMQTWLPWESHTVEFSYKHFGDLKSQQHTFGQLFVHANLTITPQIPLHLTMQQALHRSKWNNFVCYVESGQKCHFGTFSTTGLVTTSYTGTGNTVPFYLQPTLGGADVEGIDTLRGLVDYRLRAPNRMLLQQDFDKDVIALSIKNKKGDPFSLGQYGLYLFVDAGNVAQRASDLTFSDLRLDGGAGISIKIGNKMLGRIYWGFGAGEGIRFNAKTPSAFSSPPK